MDQRLAGCGTIIVGRKNFSGLLVWDKPGLSGPSGFSGLFGRTRSTKMNQTNQTDALGRLADLSGILLNTQLSRPGWTRLLELHGYASSAGN